MNTNDAVSTVAERLDEQDPEQLPEPAESMLKRLQPYLGDDGRSATLAAVTGAVSLVRAVRTLRKGNRKRGLLQLLAGAFWIGLAVAQRSRTSSGTGVDQTDVADTGPDIEEVDADEPSGESATGEEVVNTTDADIDESDTAPEAGNGVDQTDVVDTDEVEAADSDGEGDGEAGTETAD